MRTTEDQINAFFGTTTELDAEADQYEAGRWSGAWTTSPRGGPACTTSPLRPSRCACPSPTWSRWTPVPVPAGRAARNTCAR